MTDATATPSATSNVSLMGEAIAIEHVRISAATTTAYYLVFEDNQYQLRGQVFVKDEQPRFTQTHVLNVLSEVEAVNEFNKRMRVARHIARTVRL